MSGSVLNKIARLILFRNISISYDTFFTAGGEGEKFDIICEKKFEAGIAGLRHFCGNTPLKATVEYYTSCQKQTHLTSRA